MEKFYKSLENCILPTVSTADMSQVSAGWMGGGFGGPPRFGPIYGPSGVPSWPEPPPPVGPIARIGGIVVGGFLLGFGAVTGWASSELGGASRELDEIERRAGIPSTRR